MGRPSEIVWHNNLVLLDMKALDIVGATGYPTNIAVAHDMAIGVLDVEYY